MALTNKLSDLADAVREQSGTTEPMTIEQMTETVKTLSPSITVGEGIGLDENGAIYTNAQIIPFTDEMTVDQVIWEISDATLGAHDRINSNEDWIRRVEEQTYRLSDEINGVNNVPMYHAYNPTLNGMTFTATIEGVNEEFLGFFETELWDEIRFHIMMRSENNGIGSVNHFVKNIEDGDVVYINPNKEDPAINSVRLNITQRTITITTIEEWVANEPWNVIEVYYFEENPPVRMIETDAGIWAERMDNGRRIRLGLRINGESGLGFQDGNLTLYQDNLFSVGGEMLVVDSWFEPNYDTTGQRLTFTMPALMSDEEVLNWLNSYTENPRFIMFRAGVIDYQWDMVGGDGMIQEMLMDYTDENGNYYKYWANFTSVWSPEQREEFGINNIYFGYNNGNFTFVFDRNPEIWMPTMRGFQLGERNFEWSLAHYYIGNNEQFNRYDDNGRPVIVINENYINRLIDDKINAIQIAEEVSV